MLRLCLILAVLATAAPVLAHSPEQSIALGEKLMAREEWYRAATRFEEAALETTGDTSQRAWLRAADAHRAARQYEKAAALYREAVTAGTAYADIAQLRIGQSYYLAKKFTLAEQSLEQYEERFASSPQVDDAISYRALASLGAGDFNGARSAYEILAARETDTVRKEAWSDLAVQAGTQSELPQKSLRLAALFSALLPGAGQVYTGHYGEAGMAFGVNALMGLLVWDAFLKAKDDAEEPSRGWDYTYPAVMTTLAVPFYLGNIYGAAVSAQRYNRMQVDGLRQSLKDRTVRLKAIEIPID
jgi:tetratricopeptide (TPR) repeat protein